MYDVLRADRCISAHALEGRVPFADLDFVDYSMDEFEVVELLAETHTEGTDNTEDIKKCMNTINENYRKLEEGYNKKSIIN